MGSPNLVLILILSVNHKPLIKIFNDRELSSITNPRLLHLKEKISLYRYKIIHTPGKSNIMKVADITSRNPVREPDKNNQPSFSARWQLHRTHVTKLKESLQSTGEASNTKHHTTKNASPYRKSSRIVFLRQKQNYQLNCNPIGK